MKNSLFLVILFLMLSNVAHAQNDSFPARPPFNAWVSSEEDVFLRPEFDNYGHSIALLRYGDVVRVVECRPDCNSRNSWVRLQPFGVTRLSNLSPMNTRTPMGEFLSGPPNFTWARITRNGVVSTRTPEAGSAIVDHFHRGDELLFKTNPSLLRRGYLERPNGTFVSVNNLHIFSPSTFSGWRNPPDNFVFINKTTNMATNNGHHVELQRYERFPLVSHTNTSVVIRDGTIPRRDVRIGRRHIRPTQIPTSAHWVHVDLNEQVLTAYEGDDLVFATLVSTGRKRNSTHTGIFQVRRKTTYTQMVGGSGRDHYSVEGVPWVLYFDDAIALHGAWWHDRFGNKKSHGCVNLSLADARFIWDFAPMQIPQGWRSIHPIVLNIPQLWVVIDGE